MNSSYVFHCGDKQLDLRTPQVMGILNVTPDSFADGGRYVMLDDALRQAEQMAHEGAAIIDVGGESTRPGTPFVSLQEELDRVIPVIERLSKNISIPISVDTRKAGVITAAIAAGASFINDVSALQEDGALTAIAQSNVPVCLMHMKGVPATMQIQPQYDDVVKEVKSFLQQRVQTCLEAGIPSERIIIDPGFGYGKTAKHNLILLRELKQLSELGLPLLVGLSRKSMIGAFLRLPIEERLAPSLALAVIAVLNGARLIRVHDVKQTVEAIQMAAVVDNLEVE
jgi:dihydropteroate synthase